MRAVSFHVALEFGSCRRGCFCGDMVRGVMRCDAVADGTRVRFLSLASLRGWETSLRKVGGSQLPGRKKESFFRDVLTHCQTAHRLTVTNPSRLSSDRRTRMGAFFWRRPA